MPGAEAKMLEWEEHLLEAEAKTQEREEHLLEREAKTPELEEHLFFGKIICFAGRNIKKGQNVDWRAGKLPAPERAGRPLDRMGRASLGCAH